MINDWTCPVCGTPVGPTEPNPLNLPNRNEGICVTFQNGATGEMVARHWHPSCQDAERRRAARRAGRASEPQHEPEIDHAALIEEIRRELG